MTSFKERFSGVGRLYGKAALEKFRQAHVAIVGLGGVGSWAAEALARSGVGELTLLDLDEVCVTNTNRQLHALEGNYGRAKVEAVSERLRQINPELKLHAQVAFYTEKMGEEFLKVGFNGVIDAIDSVKPKCNLLARCIDLGVPVISSGAAGGKKEAVELSVKDLRDVENDRLLSEVRKRLRKEHGFPTGEGKSPKRMGISAVFSRESPIYPDNCDEEGGKLLRGGLRCDAGFGSVLHVTGSFGFLLAGEMLSVLQA